MKKLATLVICLSMLLSACGRNSVTDTTTTTAAAATEATTNTAIEATTEAASTEAESISAEQILADIDQYKADFISGNWDGSPIFIGGNVISVNAEEAEIWLNNDCIDEPLYANAGENEKFYFIDQDQTYAYYLKDVTSVDESEYFAVQVNKVTGSTIEVKMPGYTYSAKVILENMFIKLNSSLYRVDFRHHTPEAILLNEVVSDYEVVEHYSYYELNYISGDRHETSIEFDKETGEESEKSYETKKARYSDEGSITFFDNAVYSKARELYSNGTWDGQFTDLHNLDDSVPENTFGYIDYDDNIVINNETQGLYYRAMQVEYGSNVSGYYNGVVWFEDDFNQFLHFYFPNMREDFCYHSYGVDLPNFSGYTRMYSFFYESDLVSGKTAGCHVYLLSDGELWYLDANFLTEKVESKALDLDHQIIDMNWAYDSIYYLLDNGEAYVIKWVDGKWDFENPVRYGDKTYYALSHRADEGEGAFWYDGKAAHLFSPYYEKVLED